MQSHTNEFIDLNNNRKHKIYVATCFFQPFDVEKTLLFTQRNVFAQFLF